MISKILDIALAVLVICGTHALASNGAPTAAAVLAGSYVVHLGLEKISDAIGGIKDAPAPQTDRGEVTP